MKKLNCIITAFIVFILQAAVLPFIFNGVSQPNLIFVFVVLMGLHHGQRVGIATALLGGFARTSSSAISLACTSWCISLSPLFAAISAATSIRISGS